MQKEIKKKKKQKRGHMKIKNLFNRWCFLQEFETLFFVCKQTYIFAIKASSLSPIYLII